MTQHLKPTPGRFGVPFRWEMAMISFLVVMLLFLSGSNAFTISTSPSRSTLFVSTRLDATSLSKAQDKKDFLLKVAIVGAGPSGILLAHGLLQQGHSVVLLERRKDVRLLELDKNRAYALGIGIRGRTAIRHVGGTILWDAIAQMGFPSERFDLHLNSKLKIRLRDAGSSGLEPSLLLYQTDLCAALLEQLEDRYKNQYTIQFDARVEKVETSSQSTAAYCHVVQGNSSKKKLGPFDIIVGCDGVNSIVRDSISNPKFQQNVKVLPGEFKVCRCTSMPPKLDPTSVALLLPKTGTSTAFVEPTRNGQACILFAGRSKQQNDEKPDLIFAKKKDSSNQPEEMEELLLEQFPLLEGMPDLNAVVQQLLQQEPSKASSVQCNIYHWNNLVLCGDAAHATGGVSGQGVNSALVDASVLAKCLDPERAAALDKAVKKETLIQHALLSYSQLQVPEGKALADLCFGDETSSIKRRIKSTLFTVRDALFQGRFGIGRPPLQTLLTTSLAPFADIRRNRDGEFNDKFPTAAAWNETLKNFYTD